MQGEAKERGVWAEHYVRDFLSLPFVREFVFHSVQTIDGRQKEVADFLISYPGLAALISQKTQQDPQARNSEKTASWAAKEAKRAVSHFAARCAPRGGKPCGASTRGAGGWPFPMVCLPSTTALFWWRFWSASISMCKPTICRWSTKARRSRTSH